MAKKTFVIDTNILLADPNAIFSFQDNDVVLPFIVLEELDKHKNSQGEIGLNAREVGRQLHGLLKNNSNQTMKGGISLPNGGKLKIVSSAGFVQEPNEELGSDRADNHILAVCIKLKKAILVTNDVLLRVKANACGIPNQDYHKNLKTNNASVENMYLGVRELNVSSAAISELWSKQKDRQYLTNFINDNLENLSPNEFAHLRNGKSNKPFLVRKQHDLVKFVPEEYELPKVKPRNLEQRLALDLLMDESINLVTVVGKAGTGKASPVDTPTLTPDGWKLMGDIKPGDFVISVDGKATKVLATFPQGHKDVYNVFFSDGTSVECCKEHLWETKTSLERDQNKSGKVRSTEEIMKTLRHGKQQKFNHSIPMVKPIQFNEQKVGLDPYAMGVVLGCGFITRRSITLSTKNTQVAAISKNILESNGDTLKHFSPNEYRIKRVQKNNKPTFLVEELEFYGLLGKKINEKFIPNAYKYNDLPTRLSVFQGLMDTAGSVTKNGNHILFTSMSKQLSKDVQELVWSFGGKATMIEKTISYLHNDTEKKGKSSYRLDISLPEEIYPFRTVGNLLRFNPKAKPRPSRFIDKIKWSGVKECVCLLIEHPRHLYVTKDYIVTHNTLLALAAGLEQVVEKKKYKSLLVCRPVQPLGKDIGFLPGNIEEKMEPWIAPIKDNLRFLLTNDGRKSKNSENSLNYYFDRGLIEVEAMTYIRGRSIANAYVIIDEAQNLSAHELKTIITRAGEGTKIILTGDVEQIDNVSIDSVSNGLSVAVERFRDYDIAGHIVLEKGERSSLATLAARIL